MKTIARLLGATALLAVATPALAQNPAPIPIVGTAEAFCSLPSQWQFKSSTNNVTANQFSGTTWTIPSGLIASNSGQGIVTETEVAIRVTGQGVCNTPHVITVTSTNGGLRHQGSIGNVPANFQASRRMVYSANWASNPERGVIRWVPAAPGASSTYVYNVSPPGVQNFDVRLGLLRDPTAGPMIAGTYTDQLIVTITIPG